MTEAQDATVNAVSASARQADFLALQPPRAQPGQPKKKKPVFQEVEAAPQEKDADLVTSIFDVLIEQHPDLAAVREEAEHAVRHRLRGLRGTVTGRPNSDTVARRVLALFNGRNAREVARRLGISRGTVYRMLKQPGREC